MIPTFRNDVEAAHFAAERRPLHHALEHPQPPDYARAYGARAAVAAEACRQAARSGDHRALQITSLSLSTILFADRPGLFERRPPQEATWPRKIPSSTMRGAGRVRASIPPN